MSVLNSFQSLAVPFDDVSACGMRVARRPHSADRDGQFVAVQVVTRRSEEDAHDLTLTQAKQLRDALDAILSQPVA